MSIKNKKQLDTEDPIHEWFGLTYASYLVVQRSILQSMPKKWQKKFVSIINDLQEATSDLKDLPASFTVNARNGNRFITDPYRRYERGRRKINLKI